MGNPSFYSRFLPFPPFPGGKYTLPETLVYTQQLRGAKPFSWASFEVHLRLTRAISLLFLRLGPLPLPGLPPSLPIAVACIGCPLFVLQGKHLAREALTPVNTLMCPGDHAVGRL